MDIIIIGAGAAGLFCAREAAQRGRQVVVLDHGDQMGRKILASGGGRCNFTNLNVGADDYFSANPFFCVSALSRYSPDDFIRLVDDHKISWHEKAHGEIFCDRSAEDIRDMLVNECREAGVEFLMSRRIEDVECKEGVFRVKTSREVLSAPRLVVATGGLSASVTGASGYGFELARQFGLGIVEPEPALVGLRWSEGDRRRWVEMAGVTLPDVEVTCRGKSFREALLFTHTGISGPAVLQASLYWREGDSISVDLLPGLDPRAWFKTVRQARGSARPVELLDQRLPRRFVDIFSEEQLPGIPLARISDADIEMLAGKIKEWKIRLAGPEGFERAEVTRGGVDTAELSSQTMECRKVPGLYFVGEVIDVTGRLGGFNLHWAWASGAAAGRAA